MTDEMVEPKPISFSEVEAEAQRCREILDNKPADEGSDMLYAAYNTLLMVLGYNTQPPSQAYHGSKWAIPATRPAPDREAVIEECANFIRAWNGSRAFRATLGSDAAISEGVNATSVLKRELKELADEIRALSPSPAQKGGWQPIETAPKDGLEVLTFAPGEGGGIAVGYYATEELDNGKVMETWRDDGYVPTHWRPLPDPPALSEAQGRE